jgi:hypothetical protein
MDGANRAGCDYERSVEKSLGRNQAALKLIKQ